MTEVKICPACGSKIFHPFLNCVDHSISKEAFTLNVCSYCSLVVTSPRPDESSLGKYYLSESYISHTSKPASLIDRLYLLSRQFTLRKKLKLITTPSLHSKSVLDYGCGTGDFLNTCKSNNWLISGVELSDSARLKACDLLDKPIHKSIDEETGKYDVVTLWHVLEHLPDLDETIQKIKDRLAQNGTIFIAVPNSDSYDAKKYKEQWAAYDVPRHLWHFNKKNMEKLLSKFSLNIVKIHPMKLDAYYVSMLSEKYQTKNSTTVSGLIKAFIIGAISNLKARKTGNYSSLIYVVKK
jgi:SAM-dependent methyltransferase